MKNGRKKLDSRVPFRSLKGGDVFEYEGEPYIVVGPGDNCNAVDLVDGQLYIFKREKVYFNPEAELIYENINLN